MCGWVVEWFVSFGSSAVYFGVVGWFVSFASSAVYFGVIGWLDSLLVLVVPLFILVLLGD